MRRKENGQSSSTIASETQSSGISRSNSVPSVLSYPKLLSFRDYGKHIKDLFCYVIRHYGSFGLSVLIYRQPAKDQVVVLYGDWFGYNLDLTVESELVNHARSFTENQLQFFVGTMRLIKLDQLQLFFATSASGLVLVDLQTSINKLSGPGMVRDVFGMKVATQEVLKLETIDDRAIECINDGSGSYAGDLIIKPSRFRLHHDLPADKYVPLYIEVKR